jgi:pyruvate dehydrogenase E2 component (dihydrolipoamide acetyltransferase)
VEILVPDIGGFTDVSVIDVLVQDGQQIDKETPLITIETEKAAMDVPAPAAGRVSRVKVKRGDKVSQGSVILLLEAAASTAPPLSAAAAPASTAAPTSAAAPAPTAPPAATASSPAAPASAATSASPAAPASTAAPASAAAPAPTAPPASAAGQASPAATASSPAAPVPAPNASGVPDAARTSAAAAAIDESSFSKAHASPSVRKFARELGADLGKISGSGPKGRVTTDDVKAHVKRIVTAPAAPVSALPKVAEVDFAKFGPVEIKPLSRIQRISGARLQASWINLPHVTQHDDADITDLEAARIALKATATQAGVRLTPLAFIVKACVLALKEFPRFNASLDSTGENLVFKKYFNIGFAADTPNGLVVPVIRDADQSNVFQLARALAALSEKARAGKLTAAEMQGGTFTISSLGGIGGTAFTPIINAPEVAILGVSRSSQKPVFANGAFVPRLILPLSLSYDHRVIDGAEAARFIVHLGKLLGDVQVLL